jgi:hypothetical protein
MGKEKDVQAMNIEITRPEVEALIQQRLHAGGFSSLEDVIFEALRSSDPSLPEAVEPAAAIPEAPSRKKFDNLSDLLLDSPFAGTNLDLNRIQDYPRPVEIE